MGTTEDLFWAKVDKTGDCWEWTAATDSHGYGSFWNGTKTVGAHRFAYELLVGAVPDGSELDHTCRNRACVNPAHLDLTTRAENVSRGLMGYALTGTCRAGLHDVTDPANVITAPNGARTCRPCKYARNRADDHRRRAAAISA